MLSERQTAHAFTLFRLKFTRALNNSSETCYTVCMPSQTLRSTCNERPTSVHLQLIYKVSPPVCHSFMRSCWKRPCCKTISWGYSSHSNVAVATGRAWERDYIYNKKYSNKHLIHFIYLLCHILLWFFTMSSGYKDTLYFIFPLKVLWYLEVRWSSWYWRQTARRSGGSDRSGPELCGYRGRAAHVGA